MCQLNAYDFQATEIDTIKLQELEKEMDFPIRMIQVDNGSEFVNDGDRTERESAFEKAAKALNMEKEG